MMMNKYFKVFYNNPYLIVFLISFLMVGCAVGPNYDKPEVDLPASFEEDSQSELVQKTRLADWWERFDDPILLDLLHRADAANLDLEVASARLREARAGVRRASSNFLPSIGFSGNIARQQLSANSPSFPPLPPEALFEAESDLFRSGFDAAWEIDLFGGNRRGREAALARRQAAVANLENVRRVILAEVVLNYAEFRGLQARLEVAKRNLKIQQDTLALVEDRLATGFGTELQVSQARAQMLTTMAVVPSLESALQLRRYQIVNLLGAAPGERLVELDSFAPLPEMPEEILLDIPSQTIQRRPDVLVAERTFAAETAEIGQAMAGRFPKFSLNGGFALESAESKTFFEAASETWSFGPGVEWALFQGGAIKANIEVQRAQTEAALARYRQSILAVFQEVDTALAEYKFESLAAQQLANAVEETKTSVELSNILYQEGLSDFFAVLDSEARLAVIEDQSTLSQIRLWTSLIRLYKALGGEWI